MKNNKFLKIIAVVLLVITTAFVTRIITVRQFYLPMKILAR